jgi:hypothetical protein
MKFPLYWQLVRTGDVATWGWSDLSDDEARAKARERQKNVFAWIDGKSATEIGPYGYPDRPMREEILREFRDTAGQAAVLTRNSYGCHVLNTRDLLFVDVDTPEGGVGNFFRSLIGRKAPDPQTQVEQRVAEQARQWIAARPDWRWRVYRTRAGVRLMAVHRPVAPDDPLAIAAFEAFGADRLYRALCKNQGCFRARLTPKPWRCDLGKPPKGWPWPDAAAEQRFRAWDSEYHAKVAPFATCRLLGEYGRASVAREFDELINLHDERTKAERDLPLA